MLVKFSELLSGSNEVAVSLAVCENMLLSSLSTRWGWSSEVTVFSSTVLTVSSELAARSI